MQIENYREQPTGNYAVALFDIYLPNVQITLRNLKLCMSKKGSHFIGYPSFKVEDKWEQFYGFSEEKKKEFENAVFTEIGPFVKGGIIRFQKH